MLKQAKLLDEKTKLCSVGVGTDIEFYKSIGMEEMDVEQAWDGSWYLAGNCPEKPKPAEPTVEEKVAKLEAQTGLTRAVRELVLAENSGASDYVKQQAQEIEDLAQVLRVSDDINEINEAINAETIVNLMEK